MKKIILTVAVLAISCSLYAGNNKNNILGIFNIGIKAGINSTSENLPTTMTGAKEEIFAEGTGWFANAFLRVNVINKSLKVFIQPEMQYTTNSYQIPTTDDIINEALGKKEETKTEKVQLIDIPLLVGADIGLGSLVRVRANAGPVFAISSGKGIKDLKGSDFQKLYKDPSLSWTAGVGVSVLSFMLDLRYNGNFKNGKVDTSDVAGSVDTQRTSWNLSLGIMF